MSPSKSDLRSNNRDALTVDTVISMILAGKIKYSPANLRKVLGSLRKCREIYGYPLNEISADPEKFRSDWGRGAAAKYPVGKFQSGKSFQSWRSNCIGAIKRAVATEGIPSIPREVEDWNLLIETLRARAGRESDTPYHINSIIPLQKLRVLAEDLGLAPHQLTQDHAIAWRNQAVTSGEKDGVVRAVKRFDDLRSIPAFSRYMPAQPLGPLPRLRERDERAWNTLPPNVRSEWKTWLDSRSARSAPLSGETEYHSKGYLGIQQAAIRWFVRLGDQLGLINPCSVEFLADLASTEILSRLVQHESCKRGTGEKALSRNSLQSYVKCLSRLFKDLGLDVRGYQRDPLFWNNGELAPRVQDFAKAIVRDRKLRQKYFTSPEALRSEAEKNLRKGNVSSAIRFGTSAFSMALLTRAAPLRRGNVSDLRSGGKDCNLDTNKYGEVTHIHIDAIKVKNRKPIDLALGSRESRRYLNEYYLWFASVIRPLLLDRANLACSDFVFPAKAGRSICPQTWSNWLQRSLAFIGLPITPHMVRHAAATLILERSPEYMERVAAFLGDTKETVRRHYAFMDRVKMASDAQKALISWCDADLKTKDKKLKMRRNQQNGQ